MITYEKFIELFAKGSKKYWTLYKGTSTNAPPLQSFNQVEREREADDVAERSLNLLTEWVEASGPGVYTIQLRSNATASRGLDTVQFAYGDVQTDQRPTSGYAAPASVGAMPSGYMDGLSIQGFQAKLESKDERIRNLEMEVLRKDFELSQTKAELDRKDDQGFVGFLEKNPSVAEKLTTAVLQIAGVGVPAAQVGTLKAHKPIPAQVAAEPDDDEYTEEYEQGRISMDALFTAAVRIQKAMPDQHVNELFDRLATYIETNPAQAKQLLAFL